MPGGTGNPVFTKIMATLHPDMSQYVHDTTHDEMTQVTFLNGYLRSRGAEPVNFDAFRTLPSSTATGAQKIGRLTNLMALTIDTSPYTRYRAHRNDPDLDAALPPAIPGLLKGAFPAIPRSDADLEPDKHLQAIANTAAFHFATLEQAGTSLYPALAQRVQDPEVLKVVLSIRPTETTFPRFDLPVSSIIRPTDTKGAAMGAAKFLTAMGLFKGQPPAFFAALKTLARQADAATRRPSSLRRGC